MKNKDKYTTTEERTKAFREMCLRLYTRACEGCKYGVCCAKDGDVAAAFAWFEDECPSEPQWQKNMMNKFTRQD